MERNDYRRTISHVKTGLTKGSTSTYTTTATSECSIDGKWATGLPAQTNTATPTTDAVTGAAFVAQTDNTAAAYVFGITAAGAIAVAQGPVTPTEVGVTTTAGAFINRPQFPTLPDDFCPIGYLFVRTAPSASDFRVSAAGVTPSCNRWPAALTLQRLMVLALVVAPPVGMMRR
jgi:hypothetical protein